MEKIGLILLSGLLSSINIAGVDVADRYVPAVTLTVLRLFFASAVLVIALFWVRPPHRWSFRTVVLLGLVALLNVALPSICMALALQRISGSLVAMLFNTQPLFTLIVAYFFLREERFGLIKIVGAAVCLMGAALLLAGRENGLGIQSGDGIIGQFLILVASLSGAIGVVFTRVHLRKEDTTMLTSGQVFLSLVVLVPFALWRDGPPAMLIYPWQAWVAIIVAALCGPVVGYWLSIYIIRKYSASLAGFAGITTPWFSGVIGLALLGEVITPGIGLGMALLIIGSVLCLRDV